MQRANRLHVLLVSLLFAAPLVQYRVELGIISFALMEPVVLLVSTVWLLYQMPRGRLTILKTPLVFIFTTITIWAFLIRPWAINWKNGLSDVRDWLIPLLGFVTLLSISRYGWRMRIRIFLAFLWLNAWLGIYQYVVDGFRPFVTELAKYKTGFLLSPEGVHLVQTSFSVGLFSHPNSFAMYLFAGLMIALGQLQESRRKVAFFLFFISPILLALYWTYAKASLLVAVCLVFLYFLNYRIRSTIAFLSLVNLGLSAGALILWQTVRYVPPALFTTLWWRVGLWQIALNILSDYPYILFFGNGIDIFAQVAYYGQPHSLYVYLLLQYGLPGCMFVLILLGYFWVLGIRLRRSGLQRQNPTLTALWFAVMGYFAIGLVESNFMGIESRMIFMTLAACLTGLAHEVSAERIYQTSNVEVNNEKITNIGVV